MSAKQYNVRDLTYAASQRIAILQYSNAVGVSATAVAGAIIKEHNAYNKQPWIQAQLDNYARSSLNSHEAVISSYQAAVNSG